MTPLSLLEQPGGSAALAPPAHDSLGVLKTVPSPHKPSSCPSGFEAPIRSTVHILFSSASYCFVIIDLGTESVSGTLSSLQQCNPRDGFDMFAQTRGNSLAEQRKTYVGPLSVVL